MNFEELFEFTNSVERSAAGGIRHVQWCGENKILGIARQPDGGFEIFLKGEQLYPESPLVKRHLLYDVWQQEEDNGRFKASRIALPSDPHYQPITAFIAEELFRCGLCDETSLPSAFRSSEPIIEMSLRRNALSDNVIIGLIGELLLLRALLTSSTTEVQKAKSFESWRGYQMHSPDFCFGSTTTVEVKTTRSNKSHHHISGINQVDPREGETLHLLSLGVESVSSDNEEIATISLPVLTEQILRLLGPALEPGNRNQSQESFLLRLKEYGGVVHGYNHDVMATWPAYIVPYSLRFNRAYCMNAPEIKVLRRSHIARCEDVDADSIKFEIELPEEVQGDLNPEKNLISFVNGLLQI